MSMTPSVSSSSAPVAPTASGQLMNQQINQFTIARPDDWHVHLRDDAVLASVLPDTARQFGRAIVMPNLKPPVTTTAQALAYRDRILAALPQGMQFEPLMTLYLTNNTAPEEIRRAKDSGLIHAVKLYPAGATTNSDAGVTDLRHCYATLEAMQECGMPFLVHGEVTDPEVDLFDREAVFIDRVLHPLRTDMPELKVVFEHITTSQAADYVSTSSGTIAATITAHHLLYNRNEIFKGGIRPHYYCLPVLKRRLPAIRVFSSERILHHMLKAQKSKPVVVPDVIRPCMRWSCMHKRLIRQGHWINWKALPACLARHFIICLLIKNN